QYRIIPGHAHQRGSIASLGSHNVRAFAKGMDQNEELVLLGIIESRGILGRCYGHEMIVGPELKTDKSRHSVEASEVFLDDARVVWIDEPVPEKLVRMGCNHFSQ